MPEAIVRQGGVTVLTIGRNFFSPRETTIKRMQVADTLTYLMGAHTMKGGFDYSQDDILNFFPGNFSGSYTFNSLADFDAGKPSQLVQAFAGPGTTGPTTHPDIAETAFFIQDEWRVRPSLTLNAGLRYDVQSIEQPSVKNPDARTTRPEVAVRVRPDVTVQVGYNLAPKAVQRDQWMLTVDWRIAQRWSIQATEGDRGTTILDLLWQYRY
jgi:outer membrane receptor protein involved in Fe transport